MNLQVQDENSMSRERRAAELSPDTKEKALSLLGDTADDKYPIYMTGEVIGFIFNFFTRCMLNRFPLLIKMLSVWSRLQGCEMN